jgi:LCP family protein required for cell wall assembly
MKRKKRKIIILSISGILLFGISAAAFYGYSTLNKINKVELPNSKAELGIEETSEKVPVEQEGKITNILLMAVDKDENASDTLIVLTLDDINKKVKMTSIMRDSWVDLGLERTHKINYAYHYGGPLLTIKTINETYKLDIMNYMKVDFLALEKIIDFLGGVDINIKPEEIKVINEKIDDVVKYTNENKSYVTNSGNQTLNGQQAVAYGRVRTVGNHDFERTERQRNMLDSLFNKLKDTSPLKYPSMVSSITPYLETSMNNGAMMSMANKIVSYGKNGIDETRLPIDGTWWEDTSEVVYYLRWDKEKNLNHLHNFIYGNTSRLENTK